MDKNDTDSNQILVIKDTDTESSSEDTLPENGESQAIECNGAKLSIEISHVVIDTDSERDEVFEPPKPPDTPPDTRGLRAHPPLQKLQSDSALPSSTCTVIKRKACVVKLDGFKYTIGKIFIL